MNSLFSDFSIKQDTPQELPEFLRPSVAPISADAILAELRALEASQKQLRKYLAHFDHVTLNPIYLNYVLQHYHKTGDFAHICARCYKPITNLIS